MFKLQSTKLSSALKLVGTVKTNSWRSAGARVVNFSLISSKALAAREGFWQEGVGEEDLRNLEAGPDTKVFISPKTPQQQAN